MGRYARFWRKNKGQSLAYPNGAREKMTLPCYGNFVKNKGPYANGKYLQEAIRISGKIRDAVDIYKIIIDK